MGLSKEMDYAFLDLIRVAPGFYFFYIFSIRSTIYVVSPAYTNASMLVAYFFKHNLTILARINRKKIYQYFLKIEGASE